MPQEKLVSLFSKQPCWMIEPLATKMGYSVPSTRRFLVEIGYLSSFTHNGKWYTLRTIPHFDRDGIWFCDVIGFSRAGSLTNTLINLIVRSPAGMTSEQLGEKLRCRCHSVLVQLYRHGKLHRQKQGRSFIYLAMDPSTQASQLQGLEECSGHRYVTVFVDLDRKDKPVVFAVPGKGKKPLSEFKQFLKSHGGSVENVVEVVTDMSGAFISGIKEHFVNSAITVDWFHVVQLFSKAVEEVRRAESKEIAMPKATRWAVLKASESKFTEKQIDALAELSAMDLQTANAWRIKELIRWVRRATTLQAARWRLTWFLNLAKELAGKEKLLAPIRTALRTVEKHREAILARWVSEHSNARIEALNGIFQAAKVRARGYRNDETFISIIYLLASPIQNFLKST